MPRHTNHRHNGFTLVELSIVLVIIGLLIGGILGGQELIRSSELNSISADINKYRVAVNAFRLKYNALPGDMPNAESYWGTAAVANATCITTASTSALTCNGNGDGLILYTSTRSNEPFRFWQHLANAGIMPGNFTGAQGAGGAYAAVLDGNIPSSKITGAGYTINNVVTGGWAAGTFFVGSVNFFMFGVPPGNGGTTQASISNQDAQSLDAKADDGLAGTGNIVAFTNAMQPTCATTSTASTAVYNLSSTTVPACALNFKL